MLAGAPADPAAAAAAGAGVLNDDAGAPQGLSWSWELDGEALLEAAAAFTRRSGAAATTGRPGARDDASAGAGSGQDGDAVDQEAVLADIVEAVDAGRYRVVDPGEVAGMMAGAIPSGPGLAAFLASTRPGKLTNAALPDCAASYRRVASWAQARELACVAEMASRAAAADRKIGAGADGRPVRVPRQVEAHVSLALTLSEYGAKSWADLAVALGWRLAATRGALEDGVIDLDRAQAIANATAHLSDEIARAVEAKVLPKAGTQTKADLCKALSRAVIAADPNGADRRREKAEGQARVRLYPDEEGTATLAGHNLPGIHATAAMAKICAMARALKASGAAGGTDLLRARVLIGLILGSLPPIPPTEGAPPDPPPSGSDDGPDPGHDAPDAPEPADPPEPPEPPDPPEPPEPPEWLDDDPSDGPGDSNAGDPDDDEAPWDDGPRDGGPRDTPAPEWPPLPAAIPPGLARRTWAPAGGMLDLTLPWATLAGISPEPGILGRLGPVTPHQASGLAEFAAASPAAEWRIIVLNASGQAVAVAKIPRRGALKRGADDHDATSMVGRVTVTIPEPVLGRAPPTSQSGILAQALRAAARAMTRATVHQAANQAAGGCAHTRASPHYRPPPSLRDYVAARDLTCRFPTCRQPAWRGDLDHTIPWDSGGQTCSCNLGGLCRSHHIVKQHPSWQLTQPEPGIFEWVTPAGRTYRATPDCHPTA